MAAGEELIFLAWNDLVGVTRGRGVPMKAYAGRRKAGIKVRFEPGAGAPPFNMVMCDGFTTEGEVWDSCPRGFYKSALADFERETGLCFYASPELEFQVIGPNLPNATPFS